MPLQLQHIFAGVAVGAWEVQSQHMVDGRATGIGNGQIRGFTWLEMAATQGVQFDLGATGTAHQVGWVSATDALLVRDLNGDGQINNGTELFGTATQLSNGQRAGDGFTALAQLDGNGDGLVDSHDASFATLRLWMDANSNGVTDAGELHTLGEMGVASLNLGATAGTELDQGNLLGLVSSYTRTDGSTADMVDVWFAKDTTAPAVSDLLTAPAADVALPASADTQVAAAAATAAPTDTSTADAAADHAALALARTLQDEQQRANQLPLV